MPYVDIGDNIMITMTTMTHILINSSIMVQHIREAALGGSEPFSDLNLREDF